MKRYEQITAAFPSKFNKWKIMAAILHVERATPRKEWDQGSLGGLADALSGCEAFVDMVRFAFSLPDREPVQGKVKRWILLTFGHFTSRFQGGAEAARCALASALVQHSVHLLMDHVLQTKASIPVRGWQASSSVHCADLERRDWLYSRDSMDDNQNEEDQNSGAGHLRKKRKRQHGDEASCNLHAGGQDSAASAQLVAAVPPLSQWTVWEPGSQALDALPLGVARGLRLSTALECLRLESCYSRLKVEEQPGQ
jgi:hypothetical protein